MSKELMFYECSVKGSIALTSYWGGEKNKRCVQVTTYNGYSQMTYDEAVKFFQDALKKLEEEKK